MSSVKHKSLPLAVGLNFILPGAGYMYMGRVIVGIGAMLLVLAMCVTAGLLFIVPTWMGLNVIMAIDMVILFNKNKAAVTADTTRKCPFCAETVQKDAKICRFCQSRLTDAVAT